MVAFDVAGTGVDLGRVLLQRLERSVFERNHIRSGADPFKAAAGHLSAVLVEAGGGELVREDRVLIQPQDKAVLPVGADGLEDGLLLGLDNDILRRLSGRSRGRLEDDVRIGRLRDAAGRNEQRAVFDHGVGLVGGRERPLDVGRDRAGIAVLVAREQRDAGQVIGRALDSRRSAAVVVQLVQIRLRRHLYGQRLRRFVNRLAVLVLSDRVIQGNGIRADDKAGERAALNFGIALVRGEPPLEQAFVERHVLAVLILGLHNERAQVEGVRRIIIIDEIGDRAVHGQRLELPLGQYLKRHAVGLGVVYNGVDLIISRLGKFDVARGFVDGQAVVVLHAPFDSAGHVEVLIVLVLGGHGQTLNVGGVAAVVEVERLKAAGYGDRGQLDGQDGQLDQLALEVSRGLDRSLGLIAQEQRLSVIRLPRLKDRVAVAVCRDLGILRSVVQTFVHDRPFAAQARIEAVPVDVKLVFRLDLDAVQTQALLLVQRNLFGIGYETVERIDRVHLLRGDDGVFRCIVERTEVRCNRLTGAQLIGGRLECALIQGVHIQTVGVVAGDIPVLDAGIQILDRAEAVPAEGVLLELPSFPTVY